MVKLRRKRRMLWICLGLLAAYVLGNWSAAMGYLRPIRRVANAPSWVTETTIPTRHGASPTWITPDLTSSPRPVVFVLVHGYGGSRETWAEEMRDFPAEGWSAVAPCMPGQDASPALEVGFGRTEAVTVLDTVQWVRKVAPNSKIVLMGISLGAAACWLASEADPSVDAVVSDASFARFDEAMDAFLDLRLPFGHVVFRPVVWFARSMSGIDPASIRPVDSAEKWKKPSLVVQGTADTLVAKGHVERLVEAANAEFWPVAGAQHAECYETDRAGYLQHLRQLVERITPSSGGGPSSPRP
jgi:uncharacterized protein